MALALRARSVSRRYNDVMSPAYDIYVGSMAIPDYSLIAVAAGWTVIPVAGPYGIMYDQEELAREMNGHITPAMMFRDVLAQIRRTLEAWDRYLAEEARAEAETERRAEAYWENRMTEEDKAREDWEYAMFGA